MGIVDEDGGMCVVGDEDEEDTPGEYCLNVRRVDVKLFLIARLVVTQEKKTFQKTTANWNTLDSKSALPIASGSGSSRSTRSPSPRIKEEVDEAPPQPPPQKKKGGLMTAADIAAEQAELQREREAQEALKREQEGHDEDGNAIAGSSNREQETVYRTAQGQKIDLKAEKAEQKRKEREEKEKEAERMEWGKGLVQRKEREERAVREREMAMQGVAR